MISTQSLAKLTYVIHDNPLLSDIVERSAACRLLLTHLYHLFQTQTNPAATLRPYRQACCRSDRTRKGEIREEIK
jgi:hypothetical protein